MRIVAAVKGCSTPTWYRAWCAAFLAAYSLSCPAGEDRLLFDGQSLAGWAVRGGRASYAVEDGCIVGRSARETANSFLCTTQSFADFILELEVKADPRLNSGIQIRSECHDRPVQVQFGVQTIRIPAGRVHGYQVEVDHNPNRRWSGGIYDEARRAWIYPLTNRPDARAAFRFGDWNQYRIQCIGDRIQTWVNGVAAADLVDSLTLAGLIGLQVHGSDHAGLEVRWRNLRIRELGRHIWKPLWDGQTLNGWRPVGQGTWSIENGVLRGVHGSEQSEYGHLISERRFSNFTARLKFRALRGNSGFYFRIEPTGFSGVTGMQAEIDAEHDVGGLYETNGRGWLVRPRPDDVRKWFRPGHWNTLTVSAHDDRIVVHVNGYLTAELRGDPGRRDGHLALQLHGGQDCEVHFKDIEWLVRE
ncbi:MAG: DUF1080 domain-containing protein [Verrucomicrobiota bacterium]|nr:DUF1080 domain-containing protein [Limisphaera sp.]MDW8381749.1 DUF1080 domain-containing protein [Verrucomicrobiota bacterium]